MKYSFVLKKLPKGKTVGEYDAVFGKDWELTKLDSGEYQLTINADTESQGRIKVAIFSET